MNKLRVFFGKLYYRFLNRKYPNCHPTARISRSVTVYNRSNLVMAEHTNLDKGAFVMNTRARLIFKKWSGAAVGLLAVTGNHMSVVGFSLKQVTDEVKSRMDANQELDRDIVVEEDVWIGARVTLLAGVHIGRGGVVGSGAVVRTSTPPYAIVTGNPAKVVGFRFTPDEVIEHEKKLYPEAERLSIDLLQKNYDKFFINRIKDIKTFTRL